MSIPITVKMPANPMSAMPLRLFVSGIAARTGFDVDTIEDIKTAMSEACVLLLSRLGAGVLNMQAETEGGLKIFAGVTDAEYGGTAIDEDTLELSKLLIESLTDDSEIEEDDAGRVTGVHMRFKLGD